MNMTFSLQSRAAAAILRMPAQWPSLGCWDSRVHVKPHLLVGRPKEKTRFRAWANVRQRHLIKAAAVVCPSVFPFEKRPWIIQQTCYQTTDNGSKTASGTFARYQRPTMNRCTGCLEAPIYDKCVAKPTFYCRPALLESWLGLTQVSM